MSKRKSKIKKKIPKLKDDEIFGVKFDDANSKEVFEQHLKEDRFSLDDKFDDDQGHIQFGEHSIEARQEPKKRKNIIEDKLDLHGSTVDEAIFLIDSYIEKKSHECNILKLKVITGRGLGSGASGPVLAKDIHEYIKNRYKKRILKLEESPAAAMINGVAIRGHFTVHLRF